MEPIAVKFELVDCWDANVEIKLTGDETGNQCECASLELYLLFWKTSNP